jgi:uncharacterized protein (TIGR04255 family)
MATQQHLTNPPIVEALIDIRARFDDGMRPEVFESFGLQIVDRYPNRDTRMFHSFAVRIEKNQAQPPLQESAIEGYLFRSPDGTEVVQSKPTGFAFSKLKPYGSRETMLQEAWRLWELATVLDLRVNGRRRRLRE